MNGPALLSLLLCASPLALPAQELVLIEDVTPAQNRPGRLPALKGQWLVGDAFRFGDPTAPKLLLMVPGNDPLAFHTAAPMLADLEGRYEDKGFRVLGIAASEPAEGAREQWGNLPLLLSSRMFDTLAPKNGIPSPVCLADADGRIYWYGPLDSGVSYWIDEAFAGRPVPEGVEAHTSWRLESLGEIEDYGEKPLQTMADAMVQANPRNPEGWILRLIFAVERQVDPEAARKVATEAFQNFGMDQAAVGRFVEKLLRTSAADEKLLRLALMALVPVAAMAEHDLPLQLSYLRVLNGLGRAKEAQRLAKRLVADVEKRPRFKAPLAEAMAFGAQPQLFAEQARKLIEAAIEADPIEEELRYVQYMVLLRCCGDEAAARAALAPVIASSGSVNNTAWYMMTMDNTGRGRFDPVALALCRHMIANESVDSTEQDTIALSFYKNGLLQEAVDMQARACTESTDPAYHGRLARFRKALERKQQRN